MQEKATLEVIPAILQLARDHRHPLTPAEAKIWARVRNRGLGFKIRRQHPIWRFIADFYCAETKLVIEIDGDSHAEPDQEEYDKARTQWLEERGHKVIRITNEDVYKHLEDALNEIYLSCKERVAELNTAKDLDLPLTPALSLRERESESPSPSGRRARDEGEKDFL